MGGLPTAVGGLIIIARDSTGTARFPCRSQRCEYFTLFVDFRIRICDTTFSHMPMNSLNQQKLETLGILRERGESKPAEIQARFVWPIEDATLRSVQANLVGKELI